ncbi:MAG: hypothetical protein V8S24_09585 [Gordonibacter pamelaeae]
MSGAEGLAALACAFAGVAGACLAQEAQRRRQAAGRRRAALGRAGADEARGAAAGGCAGAVVRYAAGLSRRLAFGAARPALPGLPGGGGRRAAAPAMPTAGGAEASTAASRAGWFAAHARKAGLADEVSPEGFRECRVRLALGLRRRRWPGGGGAVERAHGAARRGGTCGGRAGAALGRE